MGKGKTWGVNGFLSGRSGGCFKKEMYHFGICKSCNSRSNLTGGRCSYCIYRLKQDKFSRFVKSRPGSVIQLNQPIVTTSMPQSPSRLASQKKRLGSNASLRACSVRIQSDQRVDSLKESDRKTGDSEFSSEKNLSSEIVTTSMPQSPSSIAKQLPSISKKKKKKKKNLKRKAESTT